MRRLLDRLVEPHRSVPDHDRDRVRMLSALLLGILVLAGANLVVQAVVVPELSRALPGVLGAIVLISLAYGVSRTSRHRIAAAAAAIPVVAGAVVSISEPTDPAWWAFTSIGPLLATLFFRTRGTALLGAVMVATVVVLQLAHRDEVDSGTVVTSIAFAAIFVPILVVSSWHRSRLATRRARESAAREQALAEARRLETVGRFAGGVAHDFNNLLSVVLANSELLARKRLPAEEAGLVEEIRSTAERAGDLTAQLLSFARRRPVEMRPLDLAGLLADLEPLLRRLLGSAIDLEVRVDTPRSVIRGDRSQIEQVLMNLAANARDAMPRGGSLLIHVASPSSPAGTVSVIVHDTGEGMDEGTSAYAFEPFFTTNDHRGGTGIGLATVKSIVEQCAGSIAVTSSKGRGTTFTLLFPASDEDPPEPSPASSRALVSPMSVLVVDDNEMVLRAVVHMLSGSGLRVSAASSGEEALDLLRAGEHRVDALVTDIAMPRMRGPMLAEAVREHLPDLPVVFLSGDPEADVDAARLPRSVLLGKPASAEQIFAALRQLIES